MSLTFAALEAVEKTLTAGIEADRVWVTGDSSDCPSGGAQRCPWVSGYRQGTWLWIVRMTGAASLPLDRGEPRRHAGARASRWRWWPVGK